MHETDAITTEIPMLSRQDLPRGLALVATDSALELSASDELREARSTWDDDVAFVDQVDYQLSFRAQFDFLSDDPRHLALILEQRIETTTYPLLGLYMTPAETAEFERRMDLGQLSRQVTTAATGVDETIHDESDVVDFGPNFGGIWQDNLAGGILFLALADASLVDSDELHRITGERNLVILDGQPSLSTVRSWRTKIANLLQDAGVAASIQIDSTPEGKHLVVVTPEPDRVPREVLQVGEGGRVSIVEGALDTSMGDPDELHGWSDQQPGLTISFQGAGGLICTWGLNGNNSYDYYLISASHCARDDLENVFGVWTDEDVLQNNSSSRNLTPNLRKVYSMHGTFYGEGRDMLGISTGYADDNCYHWSHCGKFINSRTWHNGWTEGSSITCASLSATNLWRCGLVVEEDYEGSGGCSGGGWLRVRIAVVLGDSGAGAIYGHPGARFDGTLACRTGTAHSIWQQAYDIKSVLGIDANCAASVTTHSNPGAWPACPGTF